MSENLLALAERCESATGPDRELDAEIAVAVDAQGQTGEQSVREILAGSRVNTIADVAKFWPRLERYTASLDAALILVGDQVWKVEDHPAYGVAAVVGEEQGFSPSNVPASPSRRRSPRKVRIMSTRYRYTNSMGGEFVCPVEEPAFDHRKGTIRGFSLIVMGVLCLPYLAAMLP